MAFIKGKPSINLIYLLVDLDQENAEDIQNVRSKEQSRRERLQSEHDREVEQLHVLFDTQLAQIEQTHAASLGVLTTASQDRMHELRAFKSKNEALTSELASARKNINSMLETIQAQVGYVTRGYCWTIMLRRSKHSIKP